MEPQHHNILLSINDAQGRFPAGRHIHRLGESRARRNSFKILLADDIAVILYGKEDKRKEEHHRVYSELRKSLG